jgi:hypothetical protein
MDAPVIAAIIAGSVAILGWPASYLFTSLANTANQRRVAALAHIEKQLQELYGPLAFLVYEGRQSFEELIDSLGRTYVFDENDQITKEDLKLWMFWAENDFIPRNFQIKTLLSQKTHLLYNSEMVDSYLKFLSHHNSWAIRHLRWQKEGVEYSWHSKVNWPDKFEQDVLFAFDELRKEHAALLSKQAARRPRRVKRDSSVVH